jgi:iron-sulfur cluster assembly protein
VSELLSSTPKRNPGGFPATLSEEATRQVRRILAKDGRPEAFLRIGVKGGGCSGLEYVLKVDISRRESDLEASFEGVRVVCDPKSATFLQGSTLVYTGNLVGGGFQFENPNAARSCGCGSSFTPKKQR